VQVNSTAAGVKSSVGKAVDVSSTPQPQARRESAVPGFSTQRGCRAGGIRSVAKTAGHAAVKHVDRFVRSCTALAERLMCRAASRRTHPVTNSRLFGRSGVAADVDDPSGEAASRAGRRRRGLEGWFPFVARIGMALPRSGAKLTNCATLATVPAGPRRYLCARTPDRRACRVPQKFGAGVHAFASDRRGRERRQIASCDGAGVASLPPFCVVETETEAAPFPVRLCLRVASGYSRPPSAV